MFHQLLAKAHLPTDEKCYVVITDIKDAFGTVNHQKLKKILNEAVNQLPKILYFHTFTFRYSNTGKCFTRKLILEHKEVQTPIPVLDSGNAVLIKESTCKKLILKDEINFVIKRTKLHTIQHRIGSSKRYFLVRHGLLQGYNFMNAVFLVLF